MYKLQKEPDKTFAVKNGSCSAEIIATLKDEHGGVSHIITDDHCYLLYNGSEGGTFVPAHHWYREAIEALRTLPLPE